MRITSDSGPGMNRVRSFKNGILTINDDTLGVSVCLSPESVTVLAELKDVSMLDAGHVELILRTDPEVVLLGTGDHHRFPSPEWSSQFLTRSIGVETMTTAAACRTYNVLASEQRRVTALLIV